MFNITDYCPHLIPMETSLLTSSLSLLPLGMPPTDGMKKRLWNKALVASHSSYNTEIFIRDTLVCSIYLSVTRTVPKLVLLHKTSSSLFLPLGHEETFVFAYHSTRFHSFRILGLFIVFS